VTRKLKKRNGQLHATKKKNKLMKRRQQLHGAKKENGREGM
jgi:hypothetical protein